MNSMLVPGDANNRTLCSLGSHQRKTVKIPTLGSKSLLHILLITGPEANSLNFLPCFPHL